jgi:predicted DNA binding CopG/RHH family protein
MEREYLDKEEQEILDSYERGEWKQPANIKEEIEKHRVFAQKTLKKDKRVNIRLSSKVLEEIKVLAVENGIPYQTLISSILHRYVNGHLLDKSKLNNTLP